MDDGIVVAEDIGQQRAVKLQCTVSCQDKITGPIQQYVDDDFCIRPVGIGTVDMITFVDRLTYF